MRATSKVFIDEGQLAALDRHMQAVGYLDGSIMATVFNMLRASDLIWPYMVDNYLRGTEPCPSISSTGIQIRPG